MTEEHGIPIAVAVDGANRHDMKLVEPTLEAMPFERQLPTKEAPQHLCMDKGYDSEQVRELVAAWKYTAPISTRGEEAREKRKIPGHRARRWVVGAPIRGSTAFGACLSVGKRKLRTIWL